MSQETSPQLKHILTPELTYCRLQGCSKKRLLQFIATEAGKSLDINFDIIYQQLMEREKLGCTALGDGIAIPHCKLDILEAPMAILATLDEPISFDAEDQQPVDLVMVLLVPMSTSEQSKLVLTRIAEELATDRYNQALRQASSAKELHHLATHATINP